MRVTCCGALGVQGNKGGRNLPQRAGEDDRNPQSLVNSALTGSVVCPDTHPMDFGKLKGFSPTLHLLVWI